MTRILSQEEVDDLLSIIGGDEHQKIKELFSSKTDEIDFNNNHNKKIISVEIKRISETSENVEEFKNRLNKFIDRISNEENVDVYEQIIL